MVSHFHPSYVLSVSRIGIDWRMQEMETDGRQDMSLVNGEGWDQRRSDQRNVSRRQAYSK